MKLTTAKQAVSVASEVLESFGGAGFVEDTGLPVLLRDSQVLPIWEGTTNVLALDVLRALGTATSLEPLLSLVDELFGSVRDARLKNLARVVRAALAHAQNWLTQAQATSRSAVEAGARRFALTLGRTMELALLIVHTQWMQDYGQAHEAAAFRFAQAGVDLILNG